MTVQAIQLEQPLYMNVSFFSFCEQFNECVIKDDEISIAQAYPSVSYLMTDQSDNTTRLYPQPILKQFIKLESKPQWYKYDIIVQFNSDIDWYFESNNTPITSTQCDLLRSMLHEIVHGLGFISSWSDDLYQKFKPYVDHLPPFLTPMLLDPPKELNKMNYDIDSTKGHQPFWGFVEYPLDKYLTYEDIHLTVITNLLTTWGNSNILFKTIYDMINAWTMNNDLYLYAQSVYQGSITAKDVTLSLPHQPNLLIMETSLNPFSPGSTLSHVDYTHYHQSPDYLMTYTSSPGVAISDLKYSTIPFSSRLLHVLAALGYCIHPSNQQRQYITLRPDLNFWDPPTNMIGTTHNPSPSVMVVPNGPARTPSPHISNSATISSASSKSFKSSSFYFIYHNPISLMIYLFILLIFIDYLF
ncbi:unnamed protein product [Cunninghamella echinulata]